MIPIGSRITSPSIFAEIRDATSLPTPLVGIITQYSSAGYDSAFKKLELNDAGEIRETAQNSETVEAIISAITDPDCDRTIINDIFKFHHVDGQDLSDDESDGVDTQGRRSLHGGPLRQIIRQASEVYGLSINLDRTELYYLDVRGIDLTNKFSAKEAKITKADFRYTKLNSNDWLLVNELRKGMSSFEFSSQTYPDDLERDGGESEGPGETERPRKKIRLCDN